MFIFTRYAVLLGTFSVNSLGNIFDGVITSLYFKHTAGFENVYTWNVDNTETPGSFIFRFLTGWDDSFILLDCSYAGITVKIQQHIDPPTE